MQRDLYAHMLPEIPEVSLHKLILLTVLQFSSFGLNKLV
jgi:hypothetical protein